MAETRKGQSLLENAYRLATPEDNKAYYAEFAASYDTDFAGALGYSYPRAIASIYRDQATEHDVHVVDIGCGTGLVAEALGGSVRDIDGVDISDEMLAVARGKGLYRDTIWADLTGDIGAIRNAYGAVVSAGTFTTGHLGPDRLEPLLDIARAGALFVIGVNKAFFEAAMFEPVLRDMEARRRVDGLRMVEVPIYEGTGHEHASDTAYAVCWRKE